MVSRGGGTSAGLVVPHAGRLGQRSIGPDVPIGRDDFPGGILVVGLQWNVGKQGLDGHAPGPENEQALWVGGHVTNSVNTLLPLYEIAGAVPIVTTVDVRNVNICTAITVVGRVVQDLRIGVKIRSEEH